MKKIQELIEKWEQQASDYDIMAHSTTIEETHRYFVKAKKQAYLECATDLKHLSEPLVKNPMPTDEGLDKIANLYCAVYKPQIQKNQVTKKEVWQLVKQAYIRGAQMIIEGKYKS